MIELEDTLPTITDAEQEEEVRTDWKGILVASVIIFLAAVENAIVGIGEFPYMQEIDKESTNEFFGYAMSVSRVTQAISALVFAMICRTRQSYRSPLIVGRLIALLACILYLNVEHLKGGRRYLMAVCYSLFCTASGSNVIIRSYVSAVSSHSDRSDAFSLFNGAYMLATVIGPMAQMMFSSVKYPGVEFLPDMKFHIYSAPIWIAAVTNFISIAVIKLYLRELPRRGDTSFGKIEKLSISIIFFMFQKASRTRLQCSLILVCFGQKMLQTLSVVTLYTIVAMILKTSFGWTNAEATVAISKTMTAVGVLAIVTIFVYLFAGFGRKFSERYIYLLGLAVFVGFYLISYPWEMTRSPVAVYNATAATGCKFSWCPSSHVPPASLFLVSIVVAMGFGLPLLSITLDSMYSKILGAMDQNLMQGIFVVADNIIHIITPIYSADVYTWFGFEMVWISNGLATVIGTIVWMIFLSEFSKYSS
ncbi:hypothetical protein CAEBREN_19641 [Caenorhabditis brenneri]|uniref:Major facilitator superfamily (MFS) profile domain-containing protein n=1 Tax=Caenorhabditis brenneri TaxID=135651 RepID=G0MYC2_CAEBE|nr:hypothetical protein CAEBREN_19641 [Caenorhabditis brenneri]